MRVPSWLSPWWQARRTVAGLALQPNGASWVVMAGTHKAPDTLCCAECVDIPADVQVATGPSWDAQAGGEWLRGLLRAQDHRLDGICFSVDDACVKTYTFGLPQVLRGDDLHFQLMAELEALHAEGLSQMCVAYAPVGSVAADAQPSAVQRYRVGVIARAHINGLEQMARAAGVRVWAIEPRADAVERIQNAELLSMLPSASVALGLSCDTAFGLALGAWTNTGLRFSPSRAQQARQMQLTWWTRTALASSVGALLGGVLAVFLALWPRPSVSTSDVQTSQRVLDAAKQEEQVLRGQLQQAQSLAQWWRTQASWQHHTVQWSRVLAQEAHGVWVSQVQLKDGHWVLQGEALSSAHVHQLLQALKALEIWTHPPHTQRLQLTHGVSTRVMSTWQFRIEADLKAGV